MARNQSLVDVLGVLFFPILIGYWWWVFAWWPLSLISDPERVVVTCEEKNPRGDGRCKNRKHVVVGIVAFKPIVESQMVIIQSLPDGVPVSLKLCSVRNEDNWACVESDMKSIDGNVSSSSANEVYWTLPNFRICTLMNFPRYCAENGFMTKTDNNQK